MQQHLQFFGSFIFIKYQILFAQFDDRFWILCTTYNQNFPNKTSLKLFIATNLISKIPRIKKFLHWHKFSIIHEFSKSLLRKLIVLESCAVIKTSVTAHKSFIAQNSESFFVVRWAARVILFSLFRVKSLETKRANKQQINFSPAVVPWLR